MALVSLSSDIEERRQAALEDLGRLKSQIDQAKDFGPSESRRLHARCLEILAAFEHLAEKMMVASGDLASQVINLEHRLLEQTQRADTLQGKLDEESSKSIQAVNEAHRRTSAKDQEYVALKRKHADMLSSTKAKINDLEGRVGYWRKVAQGEVLRYKPGPKHPMPGKAYRKPRKPPRPRKA